MLKRSLVFCCCVLSMIVGSGFATVSLAQEAPASQEAFTDFTCDMNFFKARVPSTWEAWEEITDGRIVKEYGVDLKGPKSEKGAFTSISIFYFGPDHGRFQSAEKYLTFQSTPDELDDQLQNKIDPVVKTSAAGRSASQFDRYTSLLLPIYSVEQEKIPMHERLIVVPAKKGFYVLEYSSSVELFDQYLKVFEDVVAGFKPNVE